MNYLQLKEGNSAYCLDVGITNEGSNCRRCLFYTNFLRSISPEVSELYDSYGFDHDGDKWNDCSLAAKVYNELFGLNVKIHEITVNGCTVHKLFVQIIKFTRSTILEPLSQFSLEK